MRKLSFVTVLAVTFLTAPAIAIGEDDASETYRQLKLFSDVFERVRADYVEEATDEQLIQFAIEGMLSKLDPHSSYLTPQTFDDMKVQTEGEFGGLGIEVTMENGLVKVVSPIDDTPAYRAGIEAGDLITHLDGEPVQGLSLSDAVDKMRGPIDSTITITVRREDKDPFDVTITRDVIKVQSVRSRVEGDVGYIRVTAFNQQTTAGLEDAVTEIEKKLGDNLQGFVLDLRNNPGGLLTEAVAVADAFLEKGEIVSTRGRDSEDTQRYNAKEGDLTDGMPIVVLINGGSASASEIVAGALQDHHRGIVMGTRSFGKGSVQTIVPLGPHGAMRLTTARYYTPSGRSIQAKGIRPDIFVESATIERAEARRRQREEDLRGALLNGQADEESPDADDTEPGPDDGADAEDAGPAEGAEAEAEVDYQLVRALDLLRGLSLLSLGSNERAVN